MNAWVRWGKFNLVGAMGMAVQLGALAILNRLWPTHYLADTAAGARMKSSARIR
jgi:putative flippase GtrA